jgi:sugar O-acyltransferase (sialic acid O-acetyltransferase NeuD family)
MNKAFTVIGAGGHAKVVIEVIEEMGGKIKEVIDSNTAITSLLGYPVIQKPNPDAQLIIAIGNNSLRKKIAEQPGTIFGTVVHPKTNLSKRCSIAEGTVVMAGVTVNADTTIGKHCIINTNASVDHDCRIGDFVHISPNASLAGNVTVGEGSHIGIGSSMIQGITIGKWAVIGAGAAIIRNVPDYAVVVGVPGKVIKYNKET